MIVRNRSRRGVVTDVNYVTFGYVHGFLPYAEDRLRESPRCGERQHQGDCRRLIRNGTLIVWFSLYAREYRQKNPRFC
jgi:hypothetical protein